MEKLLNNKWLRIGLFSAGSLILAIGLVFVGYRLGQRQVQLKPPAQKPTPKPMVTPLPTPICDSCPLWTPPPPEFCLDGVIASGKEDECGCPLSPRCLKDVSEQKEEYCIKAETGEKISLLEAKTIALQSECSQGGLLKSDYSCNQHTGTWWIGLDVEKEGCCPACVVDVVTKEAEINWRCTGLIPQ